MQNHQDNFFISDQNSFMEMATISIIGDREEQQDGFGYEICPTEGFVVLCDGMGGHCGGKLAGSLAVSSLLCNLLFKKFQRFFRCDVELLKTKTGVIPTTQ